MLLLDAFSLHFAPAVALPVRFGDLLVHFLRMFAGCLPLGPGGHTNQQDRIQSIRGKTKIISLGEILKGEVLKGEVLKDKPQQKLTRPGRLRARSGSKLPTANVPLWALEGWVNYKRRCTFCWGAFGCASEKIGFG